MAITFETGIKIKSDFPFMPSMLTNKTSAWVSPISYLGTAFDATTFICDQFISDTYLCLYVPKGLEAGDQTVVNPGYTIKLMYSDMEALSHLPSSLAGGVHRLMSFRIDGSGYFAPDGGAYNWAHVKMAISWRDTGGLQNRGGWVVTLSYSLTNLEVDYGEDLDELNFATTSTLYLDRASLENTLYSEPALYIGFGLVDCTNIPNDVNIPDEAKFFPYLLAQSFTNVRPSWGYNMPPCPTPLPGSIQATIQPDYDRLNFDPNLLPVASGAVGAQFRFMFNLPRYSANKGGYIPVDTISTEVGEESTTGGGGGDFDASSDPIDIPDAPEWGVTSAGFIRVYKTSVSGLSTLGEELFPPLQYTNPGSISSNDVVSAIVDGVNSLLTVLANIPSFFEQLTANTLINYVIDCHVIPVTPSVGSSEAIKVGPRTLVTSADRVSSDYVDVPCGSISIGEYYANFADYLSTAKLYLPFVGFVPCRPEWFQNASLSVDYRFNVIDGSFVVYVRAGGAHVGRGSSTIVGQYAGSACMHLPITGTTYASMVAGLVGAGSGMIAGAASGNVAALATSAIAGAQAHGDVASSNAYNSSAAFLSCRRPFLMIERPVSSYARNYQHEVGIPANVYGKLSDVSGFCSMVNVHVDGISGATETEKAEIKRLLAQGVIV